MPRKKVSPQEEAPLLLSEKEASPAGTPKTPRRKPSASAPEGTSPEAKPAASRPRKAAGAKAAATKRVSELRTPESSATRLMKKR